MDASKRKRCDSPSSEQLTPKAPRYAARAPTMSGLSTDELRCILPFLSRVERTGAASCSKALLFACRHTSVWKHDPLPAVTTLATEARRAFERLYSSQSLVCFVEQTLVLMVHRRHAFPLNTGAPGVREVQLIANTRNLRGIEARCVTAFEWTFILRVALEQPGCASLTRLWLSGYNVPSTAVAFIVAHLPSLRTLTVDNDHFAVDVECLSGVRLADLTPLEHLTELTICSMRSGRFRMLGDRPSAILDLPRLRSLALHEVTFPHDQVHAWAQKSTGMHALRSFRLDSADIRMPEPRDRLRRFESDDYARLLSASPLIETLTLDCINLIIDPSSVGSFLVLLESFVHLRTLVVRIDVEFRSFRYPSQSIVDEMLRRMPSLTLVLHFNTPEKYLYGAGNVNGYASRTFIVGHGVRFVEEFDTEDE